MQNRWTYAFFAIPSNSKPPAEYKGLIAGSTIKKIIAPGILEHISVTTEIGRRLATGGDVYEEALHNQHKETHEYSDIFTADEIDYVDRKFMIEKRKPKTTTPKDDSKTAEDPAKNTPNKSRQGGRNGT